MNDKPYNDNLVQKIVDNWKNSNPMSCHYLGIHYYDGIFPSYSDDVISTRVTQIKKELESLQEIKKNLSFKENKFELYEINLIILALESELFEINDRKDFKDNPLSYIWPLSLVEGSFTIRSFDSHINRVKLIIKFERNISSFLNEATSVLNELLPKIKISMGMQFLQGIIAYYKGNKLSEFVEAINDKDLFNEWKETNIKAIKSMENFLNILSEKYLPNGHDNFRLGKEKYLELLAKQEFIKIDFDTLLRIGEEDLERNYKALKNLLSRKEDDYVKKRHLDYPEPNNLVEYTKSTLDRTKQFLIDSEIVTLPTNDQCDVIETPKFARKFAFAAMNTPGPFEVSEANEAYYYITPPDPNFSEEKLQQHMSLFSKPVLELITIHEAWPGHYLQLLYNNKSNSDIAKMFASSTSMIEGWGHYVEEMIIDEGYAPFDSDDIRFGQLTEALIRNCRYVASIKMHCLDMNVEEATRLFIEKGFLSFENAKIEARRGTIDPMYLNYTLGKLLIKKLKEDMKKIKGETFSLKDFHNTLLSYGSPPITLLRELLLDDKQLIKEILPF